MIDAGNRDSAGGELSKEIARATTEIEDPLAACDGAQREGPGPPDSELAYCPETQ